MGPYTTPNDVWLAFDLFFAVLKGRSTVIGPRHFEDTESSFHTLDTETFAERPLCFEVSDKLVDGPLEALLFP